MLQAIDSTEATAIDDVEDDLSRELAFYNQVCCEAGLVPAALLWWTYWAAKQRLDRALVAIDHTACNARKFAVSRMHAGLHCPVDVACFLSVRPMAARPHGSRTPPV